MIKFDEIRRATSNSTSLYFGDGERDDVRPVHPRVRHRSRPVRHRYRRRVQRGKVGGQGILGAPNDQVVTRSKLVILFNKIGLVKKKVFFFAYGLMLSC